MPIAKYNYSLFLAFFEPQIKDTFLSMYFAKTICFVKNFTIP